MRKGYYADKYDDLRFAEPIRRSQGLIAEVTQGVLVHPIIAALHKEAVESERSPGEDGPTGDSETGDKNQGLDPPHPPQGRRTRRITARKITGSNVSLDDFSQLREEIIRNLSDDGGEITVEIIVSAKKPGGFSENIIRSVRENSVQLGLKFTSDDE